MSVASRLVPWKAELAECFDLPQADWTPPAVVRVRGGRSTGRMTVEAVFTRPDGTRPRLAVRCRRDGDGQWLVVEERMRLRLPPLTIRSEAVDAE